jgi:hypothetical protein
MLVEQNCSGTLPYHNELSAEKQKAKETSSVLGELTVPHLRGSPGPSSMHSERHDGAAVASAVEKICSYAESRQPMTGLAIALEKPAGKVEERRDDVEKTGRLEVGDQLGMLRTQDPRDLHSGLLSESLVLALVGLLDGLAGVYGRLESAV